MGLLSSVEIFAVFAHARDAMLKVANLVPTCKGHYLPFLVPGC
ncbi:hypothetical protein ACCUM_2123 [Candidatus Accumulibacter phosphatis]|uniref:Uncharacterized protein n=1 Tax=Candidatus Accumulibacter phosphatis TaxID=327160 RepID=A0A5S4ES54_9PROT|nr:hypothetical protein ACCUM_2123 [Candidatus Accumulibacter phosphatis]